MSTLKVNSIECQSGTTLTITGEDLTLTSTTDGASGTGSIVTAGGVSVAKKVNIQDDTDGSSGAGSIVSAGGMALAKKLYMADNIVMAAGKGIDFSASEGAGADSSVLDDYEEGTWEPHILGTTTTYTTQDGTYVKIGRLVTIFFTLEIDSAGDGSTVHVYGLPFTPDSGRGLVGAGMLGEFSDLTRDVYSIYLTGTLGAARFTVRELLTQTNENGSSTIIGDSTKLVGSFQYEVA